MSLVVGDQDDQRRESKKEKLYEFVQASGILYGALSNILSLPTHANPLISDKSVPVTALGNQVAVQEICGCCSHSCLNNQPLRISTWRSDTPLQMAQLRSWVQTPAAHWSRQIPTAPQNPIMYVRTPVQHMTVPMVPMVRPSVVRPPGVRPPVAQPMHPPAPRWIYAAGLKQRSAQSTPGANAVPKVVAVNVGAPQAKKDNLWSRDVRLPRTGWKRWSLQISSQCGTGTFSSFLIGSIFSRHLFLCI